MVEARDAGTAWSSRRAALVARLASFVNSAPGWWCALGALVLLLLAPLVLNGFPPVLDYPNHLARLFILARAGTAPVLDRIYAPHWSIIPDLGIDLIGPPLIPWLGVFRTGRLLLALALLAPLAGALAYSRLAFRTRLYTPMSAALISYNLFFVLGFMNYLLAVGLALAAGGLWIRLAARPAWLRAATGACCACTLFFIHAFGVALFGLLAGGAEAQWWLARRPGERLSTLHTPAIVLAASFVPPVLLWWLTPRSAHDVAFGWSLTDKLFDLTSPFASYSTDAGLAAALVFAILVAAQLGPAGRRLAPGALIACAALGLGFAAADFAMAGGDFVDTRMPLMIAAVLCAAIGPAASPRAARRTTPLSLAAAACGLVLTWWPAARVWIGPNRPATQLQACIAPVAPGSRVLVAMPRLDPGRVYWRHPPPGILAAGDLRIDFQLPALLVIERQAFWPLLFSDPAQHPVIVRRAYRALAAAQGFPPPLASLTAERSILPHWPAPYLKDWPSRFDDLLVIDAGAARHLGGFMPGRLKLVDRSAYCALFEIRHAGSVDGAATSGR